MICNLTNNFSISDKGINSATARHIIIYVVSVPSEYDELNIWPVSGKQFTVGIVEPGFSILEYFVDLSASISGCYIKKKPLEAKQIVKRPNTISKELFW